MRKPDRREATDRLTAREREVLALVRAGLTNTEIAGRLDLAPATVKHHVSQAIAKLGVRNRREAAYWPERPPWWLGGLGPIGGLLRHGLAQGAIAVLVIAIVGGLGLVTFLLLWSGDDASPPAQTAIGTPVFLDEPARVEGDGWTFESYASNLGALDLVGLVDESPVSIALVDLSSGRTAAYGTFGRNLDVALRADPAGLVVLEVDPDGQSRALLLDLAGEAPSLAAEVALPERPGYQGNVALAMRLSEDGTLAFVPLRSWVSSPECPGGTGDGKACAEYSVGVIDLDRREFARAVPLPAKCYGVGLQDARGAVPGVSCDGLSYEFNDDRTELTELAHPPYAMFISRRDDGTQRLLYEDGSLQDEAGRMLARLQPEGEHELSLSGPLTSIGDERVVAGFYHKHSSDRTRYLAVIDLSNARVEASLRLPNDSGGAVVLDPSRAAVFVENDSRPALRLVDLETLEWSRTVALEDVRGGPYFLVR